MPMHDWTKVEEGIFHAFHHRWISALSDALNGGKLPSDYYALPEQDVTGFGPDLLTRQGPVAEQHPSVGGGVATATLLQSRPRTRFTAETDAEFYRRKKSRIVAMLEIVSSGNKSTGRAFRAFVDKACELLEHRIYLLIVDPFPPGLRDPNRVHATIWGQVQDDSFHLPADHPLTAVAYECDLTTRAYIETMAVSQTLPDMPMFLEPNGCIMVPLEATYATAFAVLSKSWQAVLAPIPQP
jgi:hypothetical protein